MDFSVQRKFYISERASTSYEYADFFKSVREDQTLIIYERLFYKNSQARKEYLIYCNTLKFAICVDPLILKGDQRDQMQNVAGCCVHVATVIYYLSYARNHNYKIPAEYLNNIFVNTSKKEPANNPQYVRNKRQNNVISSSESESEDETYSLNSDLTLSDSQTEASTINDDSDEVLSETDEENQLFEEQNSINIQEIKDHVPQWGGKINYQNRKVQVFNTCTIDYFLFALWLQYKLLPNFLSMLPDIEETVVIKNIIQLINSKNWNKAKEIWINDMMQYKEKPIRNSISMFGSENEHFFKYLSEFQTHFKIKLNFITGFLVIVITVVNQFRVKLYLNTELFYFHSISIWKNNI